jgi:hypothetical protein
MHTTDDGGCDHEEEHGQAEAAGSTGIKVKSAVRAGKRWN